MVRGVRQSVECVIEIIEGSPVLDRDSVAQDLRAAIAALDRLEETISTLVDIGNSLA